MKIKRITNGHVTYCPWCKQTLLKIQCVWHLTGANKQSCNDHKPKLEAIRDEAAKLDKQDYSEADEQTWRRL